MHHDRPYARTSCWLFHRYHPLRERAITFIEWAWFDRIVLVAIIVNSVFLAMWDPLKDDTEGTNRVIEESEIWFLAIFMVEATCKIFAMGFSKTARPPLLLVSYRLYSTPLLASLINSLFCGNFCFL